MKYITTEFTNDAGEVTRGIVNTRYITHIREAKLGLPIIGKEQRAITEVVLQNGTVISTDATIDGIENALYV